MTQQKPTKSEALLNQVKEIFYSLEIKKIEISDKARNDEKKRNAAKDS